MVDSKYYLFDWISSEKIQNINDAIASLDKVKSISAIEIMAQKQTDITFDDPRENSIVAGTGLDFGSTFTCPNPSCREQIVNILLNKIWHYFDYVIINDDIKSRIANGSLRESIPLKRAFISQINTLLYLKTIGAESLVRFIEKPFTEKHLDKFAAQTGLSPLLKDFDAIKTILATDAVLKKELINGKQYVVLEHPHYEAKRAFPVEAFKLVKSEDHIFDMCVSDVTRELIAHLASDIAASHLCQSPLGTTFWFHKELLTRNQESSISNVIFNLELPVAEAADIKTLLKFRIDNKDIFDRFRYKLRESAKELISKKPTSNVNDLSIEIQQDVIEPELRKIRSTIKAAEKSLSRKSALGIFMGTLSTTCGLLAGLPPVGAFAAGLGVTLGSSITAANKFIETQEQSELSDMYFLWKSLDHSSES